MSLQYGFDSNGRYGFRFGHAPSTNSYNFGFTDGSSSKKESIKKASSSSTEDNFNNENCIFGNNDFFCINKENTMTDELSTAGIEIENINGLRGFALIKYITIFMKMY